MTSFTITNGHFRPKAFKVHGGIDTVAPGETKTLDVKGGLTDEQMAELAADGVVIKVADGDAPDGGRDGAIRTAINGLGEDGYTEGGKPEVQAINAALPEGTDPVTAKERDAVWAAMQEEGGA